jgi:demethylmenaquinone methyltransferase/2-methoxy-6-polyprenyl-1,4-benzoquinol methylase
MTRWFTPWRRLESLAPSGDGRRWARFGTERMDQDQKPERVRRHFTDVAERYDLMNTLLSLGMHRLWKRRAVGMAGICSGERVADLCGGTGDLARLARDTAGGRGTFAVCDFTLPMLRAGRKKSGEANRGLDWVQGDAERLPFAGESLDAVLLGFGIRNLSDPGAAAREVLRVLRPGGRFMCLEFSRPVNPLFRAVYDLYSFTAMPVLGRIFAGSGLAYLRLAQTIRMFPAAGELAGFFRQSGFAESEYVLLSNGVAAAHLARKPGPGTSQADGGTPKG